MHFYTLPAKFTIEIHGNEVGWSFYQGIRPLSCKKKQKQNLLQNFSSASQVLVLLPTPELEKLRKMLKAVNVTTPNGHHAALAEMEVSSNLPTAAAALEYEVQPLPVPTNNIMAQQLQLQPPEEPVEMEEFNLFRDYFGLFNLVKSFANVPDDFMSSSTTSDYYPSLEQELRERRDSLGSAGSEFSSSNSAESVEVADIYYTAYGGGAEGMLNLKQAFMDPGEENAKGSVHTTGIPTSFLLEHKIIAATAAKKPQVCLWTLFFHM